MTATVTFTESGQHYNTSKRRMTVKVEIVCEGDETYGEDSARNSALTEAHRIMAALVVRPQEVKA